MTGVRGEPLLAYARELEASDAAVATALAEVGELERAAAEVGARARSLVEFADRLPARLEAADAAVRDARSGLEAKAAAHAESLAELARAEREGKAERLAAARRAVVRTGDAAKTAEGRAARASEARARLEREAEAAAAEAPALERRARALSGRVRAVPRLARHAPAEPAPGLAAVADWAARARGALFVARGALESDRERIVREANELGSNALGEPVAATSVALVRARLESALGG